MSYADAARILRDSGANLTLVIPNGEEIRVGADPHRACVVLHDLRVLDAVERLDVLALGEAYVTGRADVRGDLREVLRVGDLARPRPPWLGTLSLWLRRRLPGRGLRERSATAFHYDR